ncbi:hypothetical protein C7476_12623 [Phyllobacterium bourgognense]|uniref:Uncharacterized protein n=1 Tax=Phyllobacterium bourgognense TaxID=314236 RepID=A0A368YDJ0_9HYPH|nr:hypothetical protein C7476_12623 [Phyllobacterium bourgognense]
MRPPRWRGWGCRPWSPPTRASTSRASLAAEHHEGEEEADRQEGPGRFRPRHQRAPQGAEDRRAGWPQGRYQDQDIRRAGRQTHTRSGRPLRDRDRKYDHDHSSSRRSRQCDALRPNRQGADGCFQDCQRPEATSMCWWPARLPRVLLAARIVSLAGSYDTIISAASSTVDYRPRNSLIEFGFLQALPDDLTRRRI